MSRVVLSHSLPAVTSVRSRSWAALILRTGAAQLLVQALGIVGGILVVRMLPTHEYALYTVANTMLGTMLILADGGIGLGVLAEGGRVWRHREQLSAVMRTGVVMRARFARYSMIAALGPLVYLLNKHGASWLLCGLIAISLVPAFIAQLSTTILEIPYKLHQDVHPLQRLQVKTSVIRLCLLAVLVFVFPYAALAIACAGAAQVWNNRQLAKLCAKYIDHSREMSSEARENIRKVVRRTMPGSVYYTVSSQLPLWFLSLIGSTAAIAQLGALGRITAATAVIGVLFNTLIVPRFARLAQERAVLRSRFLKIHSGLALVLVTLVPLVWALSDGLLWILGSNYRGLDVELVMAITASLVALMAGGAYSLNASRNAIWNPAVFFPLFVFIQASLILTLPVGDLRGALLFSILTNAFAYLLHLGYGIRSVVKTP